MYAFLFNKNAQKAQERKVSRPREVLGNAIITDRPWDKEIEGGKKKLYSLLHHIAH